jgi:hypothetical protein
MRQYHKSKGRKTVEKGQRSVFSVHRLRKEAEQYRGREVLDSHFAVVDMLFFNTAPPLNPCCSCSFIAFSSPFKVVVTVPEFDLPLFENFSSRACSCLDLPVRYVAPRLRAGVMPYELPSVKDSPARKWRADFEAVAQEKNFMIWPAPEWPALCAVERSCSKKLPTRWPG